MVMGASLLLPSCVDNNYDLSKDIDMKVTLGGQELTLPISSTDVYTMAAILDLNPEGSSIKPVETQGEYGLNKGDYVLTQTGDPTESTVSIDAVNLTDIEGSTTRTTLDPFIVVPGMPEIAVSTGEIESGTSISDDNVTTDLKSLSWAKTDCEMVINVHYESADFSGEAIVKQGFLVRFDKSWVVEITDPATQAFAHMTDDHTLEFTADKAFSTQRDPLQLKINISAFNLADLPQGQGLYEPGHFNLDSDITFSGDVAIASHNISAGEANLNLITDTSIPTAKLLAVKGRIDPEINIDATSFEINDIPDFLSEPGNNLDVDNPQLYLTVTNTSPVPVNINARLIAHDKQGGVHEVGVGKNYDTDAIHIDGNATTKICICKTGNVAEAGVKAVRVPNLGDLLSTVPDRIEITDIEAKADQTNEVAFTLNDASNPTEYRFDAAYDAIIPLAFGENLEFTYEKIEDGWDEDLEKYNFDRVNILIDVENTAPLNMVPEIEALDYDGNVLKTIDVDIEGMAKAGSIGNPTTAVLKATLRSTGGNIKNLNGVCIRFHATSDANCAGQNLNEEQALRFASIKVSILGGVTVDLN